MVSNDYTESCEKAFILGYKPVPDPNAYMGVSYQRDDVKFIHFKDRLKTRLDVETDEELEALGYNVDEYNEYDGLSNADLLTELSRKELREIFGDGVANEMGLIYLADGVYMTEDGELIDTKG